MFKIVYDNKFNRTLAKIPKESQNSVKAKVQEIAAQPFEAGKKLKAKEGRYSARVGSYRIIYLPYGDKLYIVIYEVNHRKDVYREK